MLDTARRYGVSGLEYAHYLHLAFTPAVIYYQGVGAAVEHGIVFGIGIKSGEWSLEPGTEIEEVIEPIFIVPHSGILIDLGNNSSSIYTLEGTASVYNKGRSVVNVTAGHKMNVSQDGTFGQVATFSQANLDGEQKKLVEFAGQTPGKSGSPGTGGTSFCPFVSALGVVILMTLVVYYRKR